jgi:hypothetical protein
MSHILEKLWIYVNNLHDIAMCKQAKCSLGTKMLVYKDIHYKTTIGRRDKKCQPKMNGLLAISYMKKAFV